jgi:hypothetical protein
VTRRVAIRRPRQGDIEAIVPFVRQADIDELWAAGRHSPETALREGLEVSDIAWTGEVDGLPVCMFGVSAASILGSIGVPWMIGTDLLERNAVTFLRHSRGALMMMEARYEFLINFVDDRNQAAKRWLGWLGFTLEEPEPFGPYRVPFRKFWKKRHEGQPDV